MNSSVYHKYIQDGLDGLYKPLRNAIVRNKNLLNGVQKSTYYVIGASSGVGKSSITDWLFLLSPWIYEDTSHVKWFYYSFEMSKRDKFLLWLCTYIFIKEGVSIDYNVLAGNNYPDKPTDDELKLINKYTPDLEKLFEDIHFVDDKMNPTGIYIEVRDWLRANGKEIKEKFIDDNGVEGEKLIDYIPNNPKQHVIVIIDHVSLLKQEQGKSLKDTIDLLSSEYLIRLRNKYAVSPVVVQQFTFDAITYQTRAIVSGTTDVEPTQGDFGDSKYPSRDANVVIGLMSPALIKARNYKGYQISGQRGFRRRLVTVHLLKSRFSITGAFALYRDSSFPYYTEAPLIGTPELDKLYNIQEQLNNS